VSPKASLRYIPILCAAAPAFGQTAPTLGDAESFAVFAGSTVTAAGAGTLINGDVGVSPGITITGFPVSATVVPPFGTHANDAVAIAAQLSAADLYTELAATAGATALAYELGGVTLTPGTYSCLTTAGIAAGAALTLDGSGLYIFQIGTTMTAAAGSEVVLLNGASADQVFWQMGTTATLGGEIFIGTVVVGTTITLAAGADVDGRLLAPSAGGTVTMTGSNKLNGEDTPVTDPSLGDAESFAVLAGSTVTAAGTGTVITGDVGVSPGLTLTGFPLSATIVPPYATHANDAEAIAAQMSAAALYTALSDMEGATALAFELGGLTLTPGTYSCLTTAGIAAGTVLTLDGTGIYVFQIGTTMTAAALSSVVLVNGASADQVFWQMGTTATLGGDMFFGTVVAGTTITLADGAAVNGRLFAPSGGGTVTMAGNNTIDVPLSNEVEVYCTAKVNSLGCTPSIAASGVSSATSGLEFTITGTQMINNKFGLLIYSDQGQITMPFFGGTLCMSSPMRRSPVLNSGGNPPPNDCSGEFTFDMNAFAIGANGGNPASFLTVPSTVVVAQFWARDSGFAQPNNVSLSDAVQFTVGP
jgi:hypothetical protein